MERRNRAPADTARRNLNVETQHDSQSGASRRTLDGLDATGRAPHCDAARIASATIPATATNLTYRAPHLARIEPFRHPLSQSHPVTAPGKWPAGPIWPTGRGILLRRRRNDNAAPRDFPPIARVVGVPRACICRLLQAACCCRESLTTGLKRSSVSGNPPSSRRIFRSSGWGLAQLALQAAVRSKVCSMKRCAR